MLPIHDSVKSMFLLRAKYDNENPPAEGDLRTQSPKITSPGDSNIIDDRRPIWVAKLESTYPIDTMIIGINDNMFNVSTDI